MDIRTNGGYAVLPPSSNKNGPYVWESTSKRKPLPKELRKVILEHKVKKSRTVSSTSKKIQDIFDDLDGFKSISPSWDSVKPVLDSVREKFSEEERIPEGTRHKRLLEIGGSLRGRGVSEENIVFALRWINDNLCDPPLRKTEFRGIVDSVKKIKEEVNQLVDDFEIWLETQEFEGRTGATDKKVVKTLLNEARKYGKKGIKGLDIVIGRLDLKDRVGVGYKTVCASIDRMSFVESTRNEDHTKASTITILYPNGTEVNEDGELREVPFVRQGDNSKISIKEDNKYSNYPLGVHSRWGAGRLGLSKEDLLNLIIENIGVGVPFKIADLHFVNRDYDFKRRHLSDLAKPKWGFIKRIKKGIYVVPEDILEIYRRYKEGSGEAETEVRERQKTMVRRSAFHYQRELEEAIKADCDPKDEPVPGWISESEAAKILEKVEKKRQAYRTQNEQFKQLADLVRSNNT